MAVTRRAILKALVAAPFVAPLLLQTRKFGDIRDERIQLDCIEYDTTISVSDDELKFGGLTDEQLELIRVIDEAQRVMMSKYSGWAFNAQYELPFSHFRGFRTA